MPKIIVSYRRSDSSATAGRIYDHLLSHFGVGSVFMDIDAIPFGTDFRTHIRSELLLSDILLAVMGPNWVGEAPDGTRRIDDEADPVRVEVETALRHGITIIPVLVDGTRMVGANQLPDALKNLAFLNAAPIDMGRDFRAHMDRLSHALDDILARKHADPMPASAQAQLAPPPSLAAVAPMMPPPVARVPAPPTTSRMRPLLVGAAAAVALLVVGIVAWQGLDKKPTVLAAASASQVVTAEASGIRMPAGPIELKSQSGPPPSPAPVEEQPKQSPKLAEPAVEATPVAASRRSRSHGSFAWYELWTTNSTAAQAFYRTVVGWDTRTTGQGVAAYSMLLSGQVPVAGVATLPAASVAQGARPSWVGYVSVTDVDATAAQVKQLGGTVYIAPADVPSVGRYALVADPQGALIVLFKGLVDTPPASPQPLAVGYAGWRELMATDRDSAFDFYAKVFGWTKAEPEDATSPGYQLFASTAGTIGGIAAKPATMPVPFWTYYFQVDGLSAALERAKAQGATIILPPEQVRGGNWIAQGIDPQGATFALMSQKR